MRHYQARCALTRPKVKIDRDGKEVTLRPKHLVLATGLPLGFGRASALEVLKDWGHQGPKLCFLGLVVRCILKVIFPEDLVYGIKGPIVIMFIHHCVHHYLISTLLLHENLHHFGRGPRYGNPSIPELEDASTFKGGVFHSSLYKNGKKYEGRGQRISGWRNSKILRLKMASFFNTLISAKIWNHQQKNLSSCDGFHCDKVAFQRKCIEKKKRHAKPVCFPTTRGKKAVVVGSNTSAHETCLSVDYSHLPVNLKKASYPIEIGEAVRPGNAECWVLWCKLGG